jgi:dihydrofolate reductase
VGRPQAPLRLPAALNLKPTAEIRGSRGSRLEGTDQITMARELAGDGVVALAAGAVGGQAFALGLVDGVAIDVAPIVFGTGKRYFGSLGDQRLWMNRTS